MEVIVKDCRAKKMEGTWIPDDHGATIPIQDFLPPHLAAKSREVTALGIPDPGISKTFLISQVLLSSPSLCQLWHLLDWFFPHGGENGISSFSFGTYMGGKIISRLQSPCLDFMIQK